MVKQGFTIPVANTAPDVNVDEILSSLDGDTRAYLNLLVNGAGQGLKDAGGDRARPGARAVRAHASRSRPGQPGRRQRATNLRRLINSLQRLNTALAAKQGQIEQLVDASSTVFRAFASEDQNVSRAIADLPATLRQTTRHARQGAGVRQQLGPTATQPAAGGPCAAGGQPGADRACAKPAAPIVRDADSPVRDRRSSRSSRTSRRPRSTSPRPRPTCRRRFGVLDHLVNMLGYFPGGGQHGYLWWLAWLWHNTRTLFSVQDANGPYRPVFIQFSCCQVEAADRATSPFSLVGSLLNLAPLPARTARPRADPHRRTDADRHPLTAKVVTMVLFALSCVGLLLFLWLSFGGPIPFKPQGYRFGLHSQTPRSSRPRPTSGSPACRSARSWPSRWTRRATGRSRRSRWTTGTRRSTRTRGRSCARRRSSVRPTSRSTPGLAGRAGATRRRLAAALERAARGPARPDLQRARPGHPPRLPGLAAAARRSPSRATPRTSTTCSATCRQFAADATDVLRVLDVEHTAVDAAGPQRRHRVLALTQNQSALRNLITSAGATFATTAANNDQLAATSSASPHSWSRPGPRSAGAAFALDTDPVRQRAHPGRRAAWARRCARSDVLAPSLQRPVRRPPAR